MGEVQLNSQKNRFELEVDHIIAVIEFEKIEPNILDLIHTVVPKELGGQGIGSKLVKGTLQYIRDNNLKLIPTCSFVENYISKHPEWNDLVAES